jgi:hypothetical protein
MEEKQLKAQAWIVKSYLVDCQIEELVNGWKPLRQAIRQALKTKGVRYVDVSPKCAPMVGTRFIMHN